MKKYIFFLLFPIICFSQLPVGTQRTTIVTDASGNVINTPIVFSNQVSMTVNPTTPLHVVNFQTYTNTPLGYLTSGKLPITLGGTGTNIVVLTGSWTNTINFTVGGTNGANAYRVHGILGVSQNVTNNGAGYTNIQFFSEGILTNIFRNP